MLGHIRKKFLNRRVIQQYYYNFYHKIFSKKNTKNLFDTGYAIYNKKFPFTNINFDKYLDYKEYDFLFDRKKIEMVDLKKIYSILFDMGVISVIKNYLGNKVYTYDNSIFTLGNKVCHNDSMQPHHDSKGKRIKIYIWLNNKDLKTHPLFYLKKTHRQIKDWQKYEETRFPDIEKKKFDTIYGEKGSVIFFDTHGIHSHFKTTCVPRSVIELTFEPFGFFNRLNKKNIKSEIARLNLIDLDELIY